MVHSPIAITGLRTPRKFTIVGKSPTSQTIYKETQRYPSTSMPTHVVLSHHVQKNPSLTRWLTRLSLVPARHQPKKKEKSLKPFQWISDISVLTRVDKRHCFATSADIAMDIAPTGAPGL
jgi:hypothetical protein